MTNDDLFPTLIGMVGKAATQRFLTLAQPELQRSHQALLHHLQQQDWQAAAALAHKLSATVPLYDAANLQDAIATIRANNPPYNTPPSSPPSQRHFKAFTPLSNGFCRKIIAKNPPCYIFLQFFTLQSHPHSLRLCTVNQQ